MAAVTTIIDKNWEFAQLRPQQPLEWLPASTVPTSVHVELIKAGKIPDPVSIISFSAYFLNLCGLPSLSARTNGKFNVIIIVCYEVPLLNASKGLASPTGYSRPHLQSMKRVLRNQMQISCLMALILMRLSNL